MPHSPIRTPKTPRGRGEALKALNKAKKYKQLDLKKSVVKSSSKGPLTEADLAELRRRAESERLLRIAQLEAEKERRKAVRLARLRETQELRRQERLRQREMLRPREDLLCQDSKVGMSLPVVTISVCVCVCIIINYYCLNYCILQSWQFLFFGTSIFTDNVFSYLQVRKTWYLRSAVSTTRF